jgi:hypothetical protein
MNINLATYAVRVDGIIDTEATLEKFSGDLDNFVVQQETEVEVISTAVNAVFDDLKEAGTRANMPYLISASLQKLNVSAHPASYSILEERVHSYLTANSQGKKDKITGEVERPESLFVIGRGRGAAAGVQRRADLTTATDSE